MTQPKLRDVMDAATKAKKKSFKYGDGTFDIVTTQKKAGGKLTTRAKKRNK